jgi:hypothetical protein
MKTDSFPPENSLPVNPRACLFLSASQGNCLGASKANILPQKISTFVEIPNAQLAQTLSMC